jgi:hypothetical protein
VSRADLAELPVTLRRELEQALSRIDRDAVEQALSSVCDQNKKLADGLAAEVYDLQYARWFRLLQSIPGDRDTEGES